MSRMLLAGAVAGILYASAAFAGAPFPDPSSDETRSPQKNKEVAVLAGGCFWGMESVFDHVKGVTKVVSGFSGGDRARAQYEEVSTGTTGHAESVEVTFDPSQITYGQILKIYFSVAHDPTQLNRQGPDSGTQYRSAIFYANEEQKKIAESYIRQLNEAHVYRRPIVTQVVALHGFYPAEPYHQHYAELHPDQPYIMINDRPKLQALKSEYPDMYKR